MTYDDAIGGYPPLELASMRTTWYPHALRFQSARAAFVALLRAGRPTAVWMPWYICDSMVESLMFCDIPIKRYALDEYLNVANATPAAGEWLLYVNYFGVCSRHVHTLLKRLPRNRIVIDNAQAFFSPPSDCLATLYSPRKFFGVPDGGYLVTQMAVAQPDKIDRGSIDRCMHLLKRLDRGAESGYADYLTAEASLHDMAPRTMSTLTQRLLDQIDYVAAHARRHANFAYLHERLHATNRFDLALSHGDAPLCYPYFGAPPAIRDALIRQRIYTPAYWPNVADDKAAPAFERTLPHTTVFLPCDPRLSREQLDTVANAVLNPSF